MKKLFQTVFLPLLPAVFCIAALAYDLHVWAPHYEGGASLVALVCLIICLIFFVGKVRMRQKQAFVWLASLATCLCVFILAMQIPFCPECDQIAHEDLGILRYWIDADWWK